MRKRSRQPHCPTRRATLLRGGDREGGGFTPKQVAPRPTTRRKTFGRIFSSNCGTPTHTTWVGWRSRCSRRPRPGGRGGGVGISVGCGCFVLFLCLAELGWRSGIPTMTARARPGSDKIIQKSPPPLVWPFGPHVAGIK